MIGGGDCGAVGGMKIGRGNRSTRRKPAPAPLYTPQIPLDQTRDRTRAAVVGSQRLNAWAMERRKVSMYVKLTSSNYKTWITSSSFAPYRESNTGGDPKLILTEIQGRTAAKNHNCNSRLSGHNWNLCIHSRLSRSCFFCFNNAVNLSYMLRKSVMPNYRHEWRKM
jgi:hypothetical protein